MPDMLSHTRGPDVELIETSLWEAFERTALRHPAGTALIARHQGLRYTWSELKQAALATAGGLLGLGLRPGDRIGIWAGNRAEWILLQLASARTGIVLVNVNPAYRSHELRYVISRSGMRALFLPESGARSNYADILRDALGGGATLEHTVFLGTGAWDAMLARGTSVDEVPLPAPGDVVNIQYTSGTTGSPKGVLLTHRNLVNNGYLVGRGLRYSERDIVCAPVPLYHCFGCVMAAVACYVHGSTLLLSGEQFDALATLQAVAEERATSLYGVPTMFIAQLDHPRFLEFDLGSLRTGIMAGAPCPVEVMRRVLEVMGCREITICYGQTEASPVITMSNADDPLEIRVATVGAAMPATEVKIVGEDGGTVETGMQGELCARGYLIMRGYDGDPASTAKAIDGEGWLHTGDLAVMRDDGCFRITGRAKDMIIRGGENIYPREIEEFLYTHPAVSDVQVVGMPDERYGEIVVAWVRLKPGAVADEESIREYCRERIAHFKVPRHVRIVESFPVTVTGKVQKFKMREFEVAARGLERAAGMETA
ncbi:MAG: AMP-binding protein [Acidobacteria bacterium]|nr:AMP-binding protein [Acidobacteriota bacterium]